MQKVCVRGVVKNGQVVLNEPLNLPDGAAVTVADCVPDDSYKCRLLTAIGRLDLLDDPDWETKSAPDRIVYIESLTREAEALAEARRSRIESVPSSIPGAA